MPKPIYIGQTRFDMINGHGMSKYQEATQNVSGNTNLSEMNMVETKTRRKKNKKDKPIDPNLGVST